MTPEEEKVYKEFIKEHKLTEKTNLSEQKIMEKVKRAMTANNFAFILADVVNSFIIDCDIALHPFDKAFSQKSKETFKALQKHIVAARKLSDKLSEPIYDSIRANDMFADSDWWKAIIKLIDDRVADSPQKTTMLLEFLLNMPEGDSTYKVTYNDFKVFRP